MKGRSSGCSIAAYPESSICVAMAHDERPTRVPPCFVNGEKRNVERSTTEIVDDDLGFTTLLVKTIGDGGGGRLVDDVKDLEAGNGIERGMEIFRAFGFSPLPISASAKCSCTLSNTNVLRTATAFLGRGSRLSSRYDVQIDRSSRCGKSERRWRNEPASPRGRETDKDLTDGQNPPNASTISSFVARSPHQYVSRNSSTCVNDLRCSTDGNLCDHWLQLLFNHNFLTYLDTPPAPG